MIIIKKAYLLSMADINYEYRDILIDKGKIAKISKTINVEDYPGATVIKAVGRYVTPGIVDPHCHVGIMEEVFKEGNDTNEMSNPVTPELRALDGINPLEPSLQELLSHGVTCVHVAPGSANAIGGTSTVLKVRGKTIEEMAILPEACMKMALGENPQKIYGGRNQTPFTRMATAALIREQLEKARRYRKKIKNYEGAVREGRTDVKEPEYNQKLHSLMRVFDGMPVKIHAHRADDIMTAVRIMEEFGLKGTIDHCTEGYLIPEALKKHQVSCIIGPTLCSRTKPEVQNKEFESAKILHEHRIPFAIMTDHPVVELQHTMLQLGRFVRAGLPVLEALKAVTISAAKLSYVDHLVGSIEVGKDADIVIWSHNPFHHLAIAKLVLVDGQIVHKK